MLRKRHGLKVVPSTLVRALFAAHATPLTGGAVQELGRKDKEGQVHVVLEKGQPNLNETD